MDTLDNSETSSVAFRRRTGRCDCSAPRITRCAPVIVRQVASDLGNPLLPPRPGRANPPTTCGTGTAGGDQNDGLAARFAASNSLRSCWRCSTSGLGRTQATRSQVKPWAGPLGQVKPCHPFPNDHGLRAAMRVLRHLLEIHPNGGKRCTATSRHCWPFLQALRVKDWSVVG